MKPSEIMIARWSNGECFLVSVKRVFDNNDFVEVEYCETKSFGYYHRSELHPVTEQNKHKIPEQYKEIVEEQIRKTAEESSVPLIVQ